MCTVLALGRAASDLLDPLLNYGVGSCRLYKDMTTEIIRCTASTSTSRHKPVRVPASAVHPLGSEVRHIPERKDRQVLSLLCVASISALSI